MKKKLFALAALVAALGSTAGTASAQDVLTGDTRLACEAILCLSSGTRPSECTPRCRGTSTSRSASFGHDPRPPELPPALPGGEPDAGNAVARVGDLARRWPLRRAVAELDVVMWTGGYDDGRTYISNQLPDYCGAYTGHAYTDFASSGTLPRYVGTPERGGYWVEARDYDRALAEYNERIRREDEERRRQSWLN